MGRNPHCLCLITCNRPKAPPLIPSIFCISVRPTERDVVQGLKGPVKGRPAEAFGSVAGQHMDQGGSGGSEVPLALGEGSHIRKRG